MVQITGTTIVHRPPEEVFDVVADERNRYDPRIQHAELLTPGPIGTGSRFRSVTTSMGRRTEMTVEITAYERPRRLASTTALAGMDISSELTFEPVPGGTRLGWSSTLEPRGPLKVMTPILAVVGRRQTRRIWDGLRRQLEIQPAPGSNR